MPNPALCYVLWGNKKDAVDTVQALKWGKMPKIQESFMKQHMIKF